LPIALAGLLFFSGIPLPRIPGLAVRVGLFFFVLGAALEAWIYVNPGLITRFWHAYALISFPSISIFGIWLLIRTHQRLNTSARAIAELLVSATLGCFLAAASSSAGAPDWMVQWFIHTLGFSPDAAYSATVITRKIIHFTYFGLIALFAFHGAVRIAHELKQSVMFALFWVGTFAAFDELSQLASPKRTGSILDFSLDMFGAVIFVSLAARRFRKETG
jgi:VanZ family protein